MRTQVESFEWASIWIPNVPGDGIRSNCTSSYLFPLCRCHPLLPVHIQSTTIHLSFLACHGTQRELLKRKYRLTLTTLVWKILWISFRISSSAYVALPGAEKIKRKREGCTNKLRRSQSLPYTFHFYHSLRLLWVRLTYCIRLRERIRFFKWRIDFKQFYWTRLYQTMHTINTCLTPPSSFPMVYFQNSLGKLIISMPIKHSVGRGRWGGSLNKKAYCTFSCFAIFCLQRNFF